MRIGIITFHWATNYGAVLQAYALQQYLMGQGHQVEIINYKPGRYDWMGLRSVVSHPQNLKRQIKLWKRERLIMQFRHQYLNTTKRFYSRQDLSQLSDKYDAVISGSDQVLNPSFTLGGEGKPTDAYFLGFACEATLRVGYAVSFGCHHYPAEAAEYANTWVQNFDVIGYRETSGRNILDQLRFNKPSALVPDPTLMYGTKLFEDIKLPKSCPRSVICAYLLGDIVLSHSQDETYFHIDEYHQSLRLEQWLTSIRDSKALITNSYHGMLMAILMHKPFVVIAKDQKGQNDRISTVLNRLGLAERIVENDTEWIHSILNHPIRWEQVDSALVAFRLEGFKLLKDSLQNEK